MPIWTIRKLIIELSDFKSHHNIYLFFLVIVSGIMAIISLICRTHFGIPIVFTLISIAIGFIIVVTSIVNLHLETKREKMELKKEIELRDCFMFKHCVYETQFVFFRIINYFL